RDHSRRPVTKPKRCHIDAGAVVRLEREAQVELEDAVSSEERPVTATGKHLSAQPRALEVAARYRRGDPSSVRHRADLLYTDDRDVQRHQQTGVHRFTALCSSRDPSGATSHARFSASRRFHEAPNSRLQFPWLQQTSKGHAFLEWWKLLLRRRTAGGLSHGEGGRPCVLTSRPEVPFPITSCPITRRPRASSASCRAMTRSSSCSRAATTARRSTSSICSSPRSIRKLPWGTLRW